MLARACGKTDVHSLEPEDLCALTVEAAAMAKVPLAGTNYIPGVTEQGTLDEIKNMMQKYLADTGQPELKGRADDASRTCRRRSGSTPRSSPDAGSRTRRTSRWWKTSTSTR